jgi:hypothetical protein
MRRLLPVVVALLVIVSACGGGSSSPTSPTTPSVPSIAVTYSSSAFWSFRFTHAVTGQSVTFTCPGSATIQQTGSSFFGSFVMNASSSCDASSGQIRSGQIAAGGAVSFDIFVPGADPNSFTALTGCTVISGDTLIRGSIQGVTLDASATAVLQCGSDRLSLTMRTNGTR